MALRVKTCLVLITASLLAPSVAQVVLAQSISIDGRFSPAQTLSAVGGSYAIGANLGKQVGSNLFHSFGKFGLATGESATFSGPATVSNVIGRVTGGTQSGIDGKIASTINGANLYLINPSGIVFGPNATVDVKGSFHASTADYVKMSDGAKFQATNPDASTLTAAPPVAFGFLTPRLAALTVNGSTLGVPQGQTVGLVGGPVSITGGATLAASAGTIHVTSAAGIGEVAVDPRNTAASTVTGFGPVDVKGNSTLDVSDRTNLGSGGSVFIRAGALTIDASEVNADNYGSGPGGVLSLRGDNQITLSSGGNVHAVAMSSGSGADVLLSTAPTGSILADAAMIMTDTFGRGSGGSISIVAGQLALQNLTNVLAQSFGLGSGGDVVVSVGGPLNIDSGASLGTAAFSAGNAGNVTVMTPGPFTIDMSVGVDRSTFQGIASQTSRSGKAGNVNVTAGTLAITNNGEVASATIGSGDAGNVLVTSVGKLTIDGSAAMPTPPAGPTGILSQAVARTGNTGSVTVNAGNLSVLNNGEISSSTNSGGSAGKTTVMVSGQLTIDGSGARPAPGTQSPTGIFSQANSRSSGAAGDLSVSAGTLSILNNGLISSTTFASSSAGSISVSVPGQLTIDGARQNVGPTGIFSQADQGSKGNEGCLYFIDGNLVV